MYKGFATFLSLSEVDKRLTCFQGVTFTAEKMTFTAEKVVFTAEKVTFSREKTTFSVEFSRELEAKDQLYGL